MRQVAEVSRRLSCHRLQVGRYRRATARPRGQIQYASAGRTSLPSSTDTGTASHRHGTLRLAKVRTGMARGRAHVRQVEQGTRCPHRRWRSRKLMDKPSGPGMPSHFGVEEAGQTWTVRVSKRAAAVIVPPLRWIVKRLPWIDARIGNTLSGRLGTITRSSTRGNLRRPSGCLAKPLRAAKHRLAAGSSRSCVSSSGGNSSSATSTAQRSSERKSARRWSRGWLGHRCRGASARRAALMLLALEMEGWNSGWRDRFREASRRSRCDLA